MQQHIIIGIHITNRAVHAPEAQVVMTSFGCNIKTRVGLHELSDTYCSPNGLILVEFVGDNTRADEFIRKLTEIEGIEVQKMVFGH